MKRRLLIIIILLALLISIAVLSIKKFTSVLSGQDNFFLIYQFYVDDLSVNGKYYYFFNLDMDRIFELCKDAKGKK